MALVGNILDLTLAVLTYDFIGISNAEDPGEENTNIQVPNSWKVGGCHTAIRVYLISFSIRGWDADGPALSTLREAPSTLHRKSSACRSSISQYSSFFFHESRPSILSESTCGGSQGNCRAPSEIGRPRQFCFLIVFPSLLILSHRVTIEA